MFELIEIKTEKDKIEYKVPLIIKSGNNGKLYSIINSYEEISNIRKFRTVNLNTGMLQSKIFLTVEEILNSYLGVICKSTLSYEI